MKKREFCEFNIKRGHWHILSIMLMLVVLCISCKDDNTGTEPPSKPFDPSKPVVVTDFTPKEGGAYQKMVIYGENFGNDLSLVNVYVGGKPATVISVKSNNIYCFVPTGAFSGEVKVEVGEGENIKSAIAESVYDYEKDGRRYFGWLS